MRLDTLPEIAIGTGQYSSTKKKEKIKNTQAKQGCLLATLFVVFWARNAWPSPLVRWPSSVNGAIDVDTQVDVANDRFWSKLRLLYVASQRPSVLVLNGHVMSHV